MSLSVFLSKICPAVSASTYRTRSKESGLSIVSATARKLILDDASSNGLLFLTEQDAHPFGSASLVAHLWDTGSDDIDGLKQVMAVREAALGKLSEDAIRQHSPAATLEDVLVPVYLYHRYQIIAVAKSIGGLNYIFNLRGGVQKSPEIVSSSQQRVAIHSILETLSPGVLTLPQSLLDIIPPPPDYHASHENFASRTSPAFDALAPAEAAAEIIASVLLQPERAERMIEYHARNADNPGFDELVEDVLAATWKAPAVPGYAGRDSAHGQCDSACPFDDARRRRACTRSSARDFVAENGRVKKAARFTGRLGERYFDSC